MENHWPRSSNGIIRYFHFFSYVINMEPNFTVCIYSWLERMCCILRSCRLVINKLISWLVKLKYVSFLNVNVKCKQFRLKRFLHPFLSSFNHPQLSLWTWQEVSRQVVGQTCTIYSTTFGSLLIFGSIPFHVRVIELILIFLLDLQSFHVVVLNWYKMMSSDRTLALRAHWIGLEKTLNQIRFETDN